MLAVRFRQHFPLVEISMLSCRPSDVDGLLRDGKADLAVASFEAASTDLECQFFFSGHIILIAPSDHPRVANAKIQPDDLTGEAMIIREPTSGTRRALLSD